MSTSPADRTRFEEARWAAKPLAAASDGRADAAARVSIAAACVTVINGMARKFNARPANVIRENSTAPAGARAISAHTVATNRAINAFVVRLSARFATLTSGRR